MSAIAAAREVVENRSAKKIDGYLLDAQTAYAIITVAEALSERNRAMLDAMPIDRAARTCWKLVS